MHKRAFHANQMGENPFLSKIECSQILRKYQKSFVPRSSISLVKRIDCSTLSSNSPNEDESFTHQLKSDNSILLGVFDGHWSGDCARLLKRNMPLIIKKIIETKDSQMLKAADFIHAFQRLDSAIQSLPWKSLDRIGKSVDALSQAEKKEIMEASIPAISGSCALAAHLRDDVLHVAHCGDSRAIVGSYDYAKKSWGVRSLTEDHQASNLRELSRLQSEHPGEDETVAFTASDGPLRVLGGLMPSRAFGDARYKWSLEDQLKIDCLLKGVSLTSSAWLRPRNLFTPPYITATPEVCKLIVRPSYDRFLVLATDGIFDILTPRDIIRILSNYLRDHQSIGEDENAATYLIRHAVEMGNGHEFLSRMLSLAPKISRRYRDDMTVQVIFFADDVSTSTSYIHQIDLL